MLQTTAQLQSLARQVVARATRDVPSLDTSEIDALLAGTGASEDTPLLSAAG